LIFPIFSIHHDWRVYWELGFSKKSWDVFEKVYPDLKMAGSRHEGGITLWLFNIAMEAMAMLNNQRVIPYSFLYFSSGTACARISTATCTNCGVDIANV